jgi:predicted DsbA family dithiol-disulfide isomerase
MSLAVDVISDVICPWCYIGKRRLEKAGYSPPILIEAGNKRQLIVCHSEAINRLDLPPPAGSTAHSRTPLAAMKNPAVGKSR